MYFHLAAQEEDLSDELSLERLANSGGGDSTPDAERRRSSEDGAFMVGVADQGAENFSNPLQAARTSMTVSVDAELVAPLSDGGGSDGEEQAAATPLSPRAEAVHKRVLVKGAKQALFCLGPKNPLRWAATRVTRHHVFESFILLIIVAPRGARPRRPGSP